MKLILGISTIAAIQIVLSAQTYQLADPSKSKPTYQLASPEQKNSSYKAEDDLKKEGQGFYYYNDNRETTNEKPKLQQPQKKSSGDPMTDLAQAVRENTEVSKKILEKLEYAFPRTIPEYTTNKKTGEKCKSNSSADCFVMPVIAEAQNSVPVMVDMMRSPTTENVKKYLEWQAAYFNQTFKIGYGFNLTSQQYERDAWKVDGMSYTQMPGHGNKQNDIEYLKIAAIVKKLSNKLGMLVFVGKSGEIEREFSGREFSSLTQGPFSRLKNTAFVFETQEALDNLTEKINARNIYTEFPENWKAMKKTVDPSKFNEFKIHVSPAAVLIYKKDNGEIVWQKLGYISTLSEQQLMTMTYRFLRFHEILPAGTINEEDAWESADDLRHGDGFDKKMLNSIQTDESKMVVPNDQILKTNTKGKK